MLVDKQNELMSDLLFTIHQHGGDDVTWKPPIFAGLTLIQIPLYDHGNSHSYWLFLVAAYIVVSSEKKDKETVADLDLQIRGEARSSKSFSALRVSVWS